MNILNRHIGRHVLVGSFMALTILVGLDLVFAFAAEASDIGTGDYSLGKSLLYVVLTAPRRAYDFLPMAAIVGSLVMLGGLAAQSEFIAMRSSGISTQAITLAILRAGGVLVVISILLGEAIAPFSEPYAQQMRSFARTQSTALKSEHGIWARDGLSFVNILQIRPGGELRGLDIYEFDKEHRLLVKTVAERAVFDEDTWTLFDITQVKFAEGGLKTTLYEKARWGALLKPELLSVLAVKPEQLPVWRLTTYIDYLESNGLDTEPYRFAFWGKIMAPFAILIMLYISVPFIFSSLRSTGSGQRILIGIVLGVSYYLLSHVMGRMGEVYDFNPFLSSFFPVMLFLVIGTIGLRYAK